MRCPVCGAQAASGAARCAICGHALPPAPRVDAPRESRDRAAGDVFVGRERELAVLRSALDDALGGRGRLLLLVGEPGIGKTRLAGELTALARRRGARVLVGRAWETEGAPPYWPWAQIVRARMADGDAEAARADLAPHVSDLARLIPDLGPLVPEAPAPASLAADQARFRFFESFARFLGAVARRQPLVLVLDDLHWFDTPSLLLIEFLAREIAESAILIVGTYRDVGLSREHPLVQVAGAVVREPICQSLELAGLAADEVARLVESATGEPPSAALVKALVDETEGNPFFLTEVVRLLVAERRPSPAGLHGPRAFPVPHGVRTAIHRRMQGLSAPCRKVLILAALLGREWSATALEALGREHSLGPTGDWLDEALEEAVEERLIAVVPQAAGRYGFTHTLIREALYEELNPARRARLHRDVAGVLERLAGAGPGAPASAAAGSFLAELAYHHLQAVPAGGDVERVVDYAMRAGDWAMGVLAYEDAVLHYERALGALDLAAADDVRRSEALLRLGHARAKAGEIAPARDAFERAVTVARGLRARGDAPAAAALFARAVLGLGGEWWVESVDANPRLRELLEEARRGLDPGDSALRAQVLGRTAVALYFDAAARPRRLALSEEAVEMARRVGDPVTLALTLGSRHWALWDPAHLDERLAVAGELVRLAEAIGARDIALQAHAWRLGDLLERGEIEAVDAEIEIFARLAAEQRQPVYQWWTPMFRAMRALLEGRLADAERLVEDGVAIGQRVQGGVAIAIFGSYLVWLRRAQGRVAELEAVVRGMVDQHPAETSWRSVLAFVYAELGRVDAAREEFERLAARDFADLAHDLRLMTTMAMLAQVAAAVGDARRAAQLYDLLRPYAGLVIVTASGAGPCLGAVSRYLGLLATTVGRLDEAERHFRDAIALNARLRSRPLVAFAQHEYGVALARRGRPGDHARAREFAAAALATARELGMTGLREKIEAGQLAAPAPPAPAVRKAPPSPAGRAAVTAPANVFRRDGEYWTLVYQEGVCRLKDAKGLHYLRALVERPGSELHVLDLAAITDARPARATGREEASAEELAGEDLHVAGPGERATRPDIRARQAYKGRVTELYQELEEAERFNDTGRADRLREEIEALRGELAAAYGVGGARKRAGGDEQARKNVTNCIRNSVARIAKSNPALGRHLLAAVRTGVFCSYRPEQSIAWEV